jgi:hypothetical protein
VYLWSRDNQKDIEFSEHVTAVSDTRSGAKLVAVTADEPYSKKLPTRKYEVSDRGVFSVYENNGVVRPQFPRLWCELKLPHKDGQTWVVGAPADTTVTARGPERVEVPAGVFSAIRVEYRSGQHPDPQVTRYMAPRVGMVKTVYRQEERGIVVLKSFTHGK